ncbi:hypothetical protein [Phenylobacterium sp.]|uniref:hypothetical protein n=1 Tax=Phenylobacterium sp. TaxID=1871053 RepID=UPI0035B17CEE
MVMRRREMLGALGAGALAQVAAGAAKAAPRLDVVNPAWLISEEEAVAWHRQKDRLGPTLTGNESWRAFMGFLEEKLRGYGCADVHRSAWRFPRFVTSMWPDDSKWSLTSGGRRVPLANVGANCGTTGPQGVTAELVLWDPDAEPDVRGKIVVFRPRERPDVREAFSNSDYEYITPFRSWPDEGRPVSQVQNGAGSVAAPVWDEMTSTATFVNQVRDRGPAGVVFAMNLNRALTEGLYTFPPPMDYGFPSVYVDRRQGDLLVADARARRSATLRVEGERQDSEAYQLIAYLPGRNYGAPADEQVQLRTHTDGPSISQDNGALGLLAVVRYMSRVPRAERPRTLMIELDCRHFMPGLERAWLNQDYFAKNPRARERIVAMIAMEHLGQIDYVADGDEIRPSGRSLPTWLYATGNQGMIDAALKAVRDNDLPSAVIRSPGRPGVHGGSQGPWYGLGRGASELGIPGYGVQGDLGAYWAHSARVDRFDARAFRRQVATFCQLTGFLMAADLGPLQAPKAVPRAG